MKCCSKIRKILAVLLTLLMMLCLASCSGKTEAKEQNLDGVDQAISALDVTSSNIPKENVEDLGDMVVGFMTECLDVEQAEDTEYASPDIYPPFGEDKSETMDSPNDAANALYRLCYEQPEVLASTMSAFPSVTGLEGLSVDHPIELDQAIEAADGKIVQETLLAKLKALLEADTTQVVFGYWSGPTKMIYMVKRDENAEASPANMTLQWEDVMLEDEPIFGIAVPRETGDKDFGFFAMKYGFQRVIPIIEYPKPD